MAAIFFYTCWQFRVSTVSSDQTGPSCPPGLVDSDLAWRHVTGVAKHRSVQHMTVTPETVAGTQKLTHWENMQAQQHHPAVGAADQPCEPSSTQSSKMDMTYVMFRSSQPAPSPSQKRKQDQSLVRSISIWEVSSFQAFSSLPRSKGNKENTPPSLHLLHHMRVG